MAGVRGAHGWSERPLGWCRMSASLRHAAAALGRCGALVAHRPTALSRAAHTMPSAAPGTRPPPC
eukprot:832454-Prymnesium_polylepis.2